MNGDGLGDVGEDFELEELLGWDEGDGPTWRMWVLAVGGAATILALAVIRRRALARKVPMAVAARATRAAEPGKLELGRGQWAHLGMVFDPVALDDDVASSTQ